ncbi:hypothetical protein [Psychroserpens sp. SPM9]|uniref:hypothetical protein n=1 Tax=Psychroserpens sp. SPM9 TaxID=2975598 RepID=UPI0021A7F56B|nr:hypothetical protein [Psychroserpens sp. SPM9]MDG5492389.1 hypothetical protein [Psychroserpens sp. SPM9]
MKNLILITLSLFVGNLVNSQSSSTNCTLTTNTNHCNSANNFPALTPSFLDVQFSDVYYKSDELKWKKATLLINNQPKIVSARYNALYDAIEVKNNNKIYKLKERPNLNIAFLESNETYQYISYYGDDGLVYSSYFIVDHLSDELGVFRKQAFQKARDRYLGTDSKIEITDVYYMLDQNNKLVHLTTSKRTIKKAFPDKAAAIIKFVKTNNINKRKQEDLITLARYIKSLIQDKNLG